MPFAFIQVPAGGQGDAKEALNRLLRGGRIASVRKDFVAHGEDSFWAFCIEYLDPGPLSDGEGRPGVRNERVDYKQILAPEIFAVFSRLRAVRKELVEKEAIPAYAIFTNEQLAEIARLRPDSHAALGRINGIGELESRRSPKPDFRLSAVPSYI